MRDRHPVYARIRAFQAGHQFRAYEVGAEDKPAFNALGNMVNVGYLRRVKRGVYQRTDKPMDAPRPPREPSARPSARTVVEFTIAGTRWDGVVRPDVVVRTPALAYVVMNDAPCVVVAHDRSLLTIPFHEITVIEP